MHRLIRLLGDGAEAAARALAMAAIAYLLAVVAFNVAARIVFDLSGAEINLMIPGAIEQASYVLGLIVLAALGAAMPSGMISVDLFTERLPAPLRTGLARLWYAVVLVLALVLVWLLAHETLALAARGEQSQDLRLPMSWITGAFTLECLLLALICLREAVFSTGGHGELS
ncbi:MAG: TRAP transporter small permease [Qingshengfaniella sp.]